MTSFGGTQLIVTPSAQGKVLCASFRVTLRMSPLRIRSTCSSGFIPLSSEGQKSSVSLPATGFHMAAWGPARARFASEPLMCTERVRLTMVFCEADAEDASACITAPLILSR